MYFLAGNFYHTLKVTKETTGDKFIVRPCWRSTALAHFSDREATSIAKRSYTALAGNRTRASRVAGENSTTEPPVLGW